MGVYLVATRLVKLLKKVRRTESTGTNEIKNQNASSTLTEARPLCRYMKFKEFKGLLYIFPNFGINWFLHHTVIPYKGSFFAWVSACFLERYLSGMGKIHFSLGYFQSDHCRMQRQESGNSTTEQLPSAILESSIRTKRWDMTSTAHVRSRQQSPNYLAGSSQLQLIST